ncbi:hypothetical protein [Streptomyces sp. NPDC020362]|uniref:hypothetical protein n=1 Tax=unclassified Streptomyces TaxID=2593676 RepID=UPI0033D1D1E6
MEASESTAWIMPLLNQVSSGAAGTVEGAAGAEVVRVVRERLGSSPGGNAALDRIGEEPGEVERRLTAAIGADAAFADQPIQLREEVRQQAPSPRYAGRDMNTAVLGAHTKGNTITFGPLTIHRTNGTGAKPTALVLVVAVILGLAVYGLVRVVDGRDSGAQGTTSAGATGAGDGDGAQTPLKDVGDPAGGQAKVAPVRDLALAKGVLPDLQSMPSGWSLSEKANTRRTTDSSMGSCGGLLSEGEVAYAVPGGSDQASILVDAYDSADAAAAGYRHRAGPVGSGTTSRRCRWAGSATRASRSPSGSAPARSTPTPWQPSPGRAPSCSASATAAATRNSTPVFCRGSPAWSSSAPARRRTATRRPPRSPGLPGAAAPDRAPHSSPGTGAPEGTPAPTYPS